MFVVIWNGYEIVCFDDIVIVEGNYYFFVDSVDLLLLEDSVMYLNCLWKGVVSYKMLVVDGKCNVDVVWYYLELKFVVVEIKGWYVFWKGVMVG